MKIIKPTVVTDAIVTANNIAVSAYPEWNVATPYTAGQYVKVDSVHKEYLCLISNTGQNPSTIPALVDGAGDPYWKDVGSTNDWALFDGRSRKASVNPTSIVVSVKPTGITNSIAILNIIAGTLNVTAVSDSAGEVYNKDFVLRQYVNSFYDWFFAPIEGITNAVRIDLPAYTDMTITLTATASSGNVTIGEFVFGKLQNIGKTQYGTSLGINDYSTKDTDDFGNFIVTERGFANRIEYDVVLDANKTASTRRFLANYRAQPLVYIGDENLPETVTYGFYKRFNEVLSNYALTSLVLEVEELS